MENEKSSIQKVVTKIPQQFFSFTFQQLLSCALRRHNGNMKFLKVSKIAVATQ